MAQGFDGVTGDPQAAVLATSYRLQGRPCAGRPVCFAFNGGPGSASIWLHLGALGPKRIVVPDDGRPPRAVSVVDNPLTWLEHFDLVFIDPPHTGWSITASEAARKRMLGVDGDVEALAEVMRVWLTRHQRWGSPVYLAGESYGTTRGAALADTLQSAGVALSGLILISCAMDLQTLDFAPPMTCRYALFLPAFANVSQYHGLLKGALGESPAAARTAAEAFVADDYLAALHAGAAWTASARTRLARRIAELTGLPQGLVEDHNLRISDQTYFFEALRPQGRMVGRLDARATGPMGATRGRAWEFDPGIEAIAPAYTAAAHGLLRADTGPDDGAALRGAEPRHPQGLELEPRRDHRRRLCQHHARPGARAAPQPAPARAGGQRPLRPGHAVQRHRLVAGASGHSRRRGGAHHPPLLRRRPHDVHAQRRPGRLKTDLAAWLGA
jgi:carboxypeptidase C (cathepsin A)